MELLNYQSPRSVNLIIRSLSEKGYLVNDEFGRVQVNNYPDYAEAETVEIPLLGSIACGYPNFAEQDIEESFCLSTMLAKPPHQYFILKARGDSMEQKGIQDGDLVLIRKQPTARNGETVAALVDQECTLKEFYREKDFIILKPCSLNTIYRPIILTSDFTILGVMVSILPRL